MIINPPIDPISEKKKCPLCAETIEAEAKVCHFCGAQFAVTVRGYCARCHILAEANDAGRCRKCGGEVIDRHVESLLLSAVPGPGQAQATLPVAAPASEEKELEMWERKGESVGERLAASLLDQFIIYLISSVGLGFSAFTLGRSLDSEALAEFGTIGYLALIPVVWFLYFTLLEGTFGTTLGKRIRRLKVVRADGSRCGYGRAALRALLGIFETNLIGALVIAFTERRQRLGDMLAGTLVASTRKLQHVTFDAGGARFERVDGTRTEMARLTHGDVLKFLSFHTGLRLEGVEPSGRAKVVTLRRSAFPSTQKMERLRSELESHFNLRFSERLDAAAAAGVLVGLVSLLALIALSFWVASLPTISSLSTPRPTFTLPTSAAVTMPTEGPAPTQRPEPTAIAAATAAPLDEDPTHAFADPILARIANHPPDFEDDFSTGSGRYMRWSAMTSGWTVADGVFRAAVTDGWIDAGGSLIGTDFVLRFKFRPVAVNDSSWLGLLFRAAGDDHYTFGLGLEGGVWDISREKSGTTTLAEGGADMIQVLSWTEVLLVAEGDQMALLVNDQPMAYVRDSAVRGDWSSLRVESTRGTTQLEIDDVRFWRLDEGPVPTARPIASPAPTVTAAGQPPAAGEGTATGRILWNNQPFVGVRVKLCADWSMFGGCKTAAYTAITDADGRYSISAIPAGEYDFITQLPDQRNDTLWLGLKVTVGAGQTVMVRDVPVVKYDLNLIAPANHQRVTTATPTLAWEAYPGAAYYEVYVSSRLTYETVVSFERAQTPEYIIPTALAAGEYYWRIYAYNAGGTRIAESRESFDFTIGD